MPAAAVQPPFLACCWPPETVVFLGLLENHNLKMIFNLFNAFLIFYFHVSILKFLLSLNILYWRKIIPASYSPQFLPPAAGEKGYVFWQPCRCARTIPLSNNEKKCFFMHTIFMLGHFTAWSHFLSWMW